MPSDAFESAQLIQALQPLSLQVARRGRQRRGIWAQRLQGHEALLVPTFQLVPLKLNALFLEPECYQGQISLELAYRTTILVR